VTPVSEEVARWLEGVYSVSVEPPQEGAVGFDVYFERGGERFKLHTDFSDFYLSCASCSGANAESVLRTVAEALGIEPELKGGERGEKRLVLPADVGWAMFLKLWHKYNMSLRVEEGGRELLRVEVLEARASGFAKFRLWYYKWSKTRPHQPYVDVELRPYPLKDNRIRFIGHVSANEAEGILRKHLAEIVDLLKREGMEGVSLTARGKQLYFTGAFRDSVLAKLGIRPELPPGEPPEVQHLGGYKFIVGGREVEFGERAFGATREFYAELKFPSREGAERFARSLKAIDIDAKVRGNTVRLDSDAFFGLLAATNAAPPGLTPLYRSKDLQVYTAVEGGRTRFYFAVRHGNAWRVAEGLYAEKWVLLSRREREVLEAIRDAVAKALKQLGGPADVGEPKEDRGEGGDVKAYYFRLHSHHLAPFLKHAAEDVRAEPAEVRLEGRSIVISAGGVKAEVEFKLLKGKEAEFLMAKDVAQILALYKSLREAGVRVEIAPKGVKVDSETLWALVAATVERSPPNVLPAEVMPGVELLKVYNVGGMHMYIFRAEGVHYYFAVKTEKEWRVAGGKYNGRQVQIHGEAARTVADAINALYSQMGIERRIGVKYGKDGTPYIKLTNVDLRLLSPR